MSAPQVHEPSIVWRPAPRLQSVELLEVSNCPQDWTVAHADTFTFCVVHDTDPRGGTATYRHWTHPVHVGDLQLFEPGEVHRAIAHGYPSSFRVVQIPADLVRSAWRELGMTDAGPHFKVPVARSLYRAFSAMITTIGCEDVDRLHAQSALTEAIATLLGDEHVCARAVRPAPSDMLRTRRAKEYIDACVDDTPWAAPHLDEIVAAASIRGRFALCRDFRKIYGISPVAYVKARKVQLARNLLRRGLDVSAVARETGYTLPAFSRAFSAYVGMPPSDYRSAFTR